VTAVLDRPTVDNGTRREFVLGGVSLAGLLAACGGDESARVPRTRRVRDTYGSVEVPTRPERVVADTVTTMANMVALDFKPIGAAVPVGIRPGYVGDGAAGVENVVAEDGWTIDLERALALRTDLIIAIGADYSEPYCRRYKQALPTFCYADGYKSLPDIKANLTVIAGILGREHEAREVLGAFDNRVAGLRARVGEAGLAGESVAVVRFDAGGWFGIRVGQPGNVVLRALDFQEPTWSAPVKEDYVELSLERLDLLNQAHTLLICTDDDVDPAKLDVLDSKLWRGLAPVRGGRALEVGAWNGSDMLQMSSILDELERVLIAPAESS
jgi:iron complex transport system substrate-binding protein